jgi:hypothetical protein
MADLYSDYLASVLKNLDQVFADRRKELGRTLAVSGKLGQPVTNQLFSDMESDYIDKVSQIIPQIELQKRQEQINLQFKQDQFAEQKRAQLQSEALQKLSMEQQANQFNRSASTQEAGLLWNKQLQEEHIQAQNEAAKASAADWWKAPLGALVGTGVGAIVGGPAGASIGSQAGSALGGMFSKKSSSIPDTSKQTYTMNRKNADNIYF